MRILWLCPYPIGDLSPDIVIERRKQTHPSSWVVRLAEKLKELKDVELHILTMSPYVRFNQSAKIRGITYHVIRYAIPGTFSGYPVWFPWGIVTGYRGFIVQAQELIEKEIKPDIVHVHGTESAYGSLSLRLSVPCLISIQGILKYIAPFERDFWSDLKIRREKKVVSGNSFFGCRTDFDKHFVKSLNQDAQIFHLPEAIGEVFFKKSIQTSTDEIRIIFVGSLIPRKGIFDLIQAFSKLEHNVMLRVIGSGPAKELQRIQNLITDQNLSERITLLGMLEADAIANEFMNAQIFVLPSYIENSPNSLLEAMASGLTCVASNVGGIPSLIKHEETGLLFEAGNINDLLAKISLAIDNSELRNQLGVNARSFASSFFSPKNALDAVYDAYQSMKKVN